MNEHIYNLPDCQNIFICKIHGENVQYRGQGNILRNSDYKRTHGPKPRFNVVGLPHHVMQRGNNRQECFFNDEDRLFYCECLKEASKKYRCDIHTIVFIGESEKVSPGARRKTYSDPDSMPPSVFNSPAHNPLDVYVAFVFQTLFPVLFFIQNILNDIIVTG